MSVPRIYLDHAATTPLRPEARAAMLQGFESWANPSSPHAEGRRARALLEDARDRIKRAFGWRGEAIFTSGASEALQIGLARGAAKRQLVSAVEHDAVFRAAPGAQVLPIGPDGTIDRDGLAADLANGPKAVVAIQHVNSETGTMQPVTGLAGVVRESGGLLLSDCSQSAGKYALPDADMIVVSAHKLGGPIGIGALLVRDFAMLTPTGGQERGYRSGTENLPAALGFAAAAEARAICAETVGSGAFMTAVAGMAQWTVTSSLAFIDIEYAINRLGGTFQPDCSRLDDLSILSITMPGVSSAVQLIEFDAAGIAVSAGSACSSGTLKSSRVLKAFGVPDEAAGQTIRMSAGWTTTYMDIMKFADVWQSIARKAARRA